MDSRDPITYGGISGGSKSVSNEFKKICGLNSFYY